MKNVAKFISADKTQKLTVVIAQGKSGYNVKASVKGTQKGAPKAATGARASGLDVAPANDAFKALCEQAVKEGWVEQRASVRNAFISIPKPGAIDTTGVVAAKAVKKTKTA